MEVLSVVTNIVSLVQVTCHIINRINDFNSKAGGLPRTLQTFAIELPTLKLTLERLDQAVKNGLIPDDSIQALCPILENCGKEILALKNIIDKVVVKGDSSVIFKAVASFRYDDEVEERKKAIKDYLGTLMLERFISNSSNGIVLPKVAPIPQSVGLFRQDPHFVNRTILDDVIAKSSIPGSRLAIVGIGGIGKSQIAIEYAHRTRSTSSDTWVFWVKAATVATFEQSYRDIAKAIGIPSYNNAKVNILKNVYDWLSDENNGRWMMILDNADDMAVFTATAPPMSDTHHGQRDTPNFAAPRVLDFLPESRNGSILITSRNREVARLITGSYPQILALNEMNQLEAIELFTKKSVGNHDPAEVAELVKKLDYIPLAISQAASYIAERAGRMTVPKYMEELKNLDQKALELLGGSISEPHRNKERSNSVIATWMVSFRYIQNTTPSAARLLSLMCLFDRHAIPEDLLAGQYAPAVIAAPKKLSWWRRRRRLRQKKPCKEKLNVVMDCNFEKDWLTLTNLSLIKTGKDGNLFEMHRLVQLTTKRWLESQQTLTYWTENYVTIMHAHYPWPEGNTNDWNKCQALFPHAQMAISYRPTEKALLQTWGFLLQNAAAYAHEKGLFQDAEAMNRAAVSAWESTFGKGHPNTLRLLSNLGQMLHSLDRLPEAEKIQRKVLALREQMYGEKNEETLKSVYAVGNVLYTAGRLEEAEKMFRKAMEGREKIHGITHRETRLVVARLMSTLKALGREEEADMLMIRAFPSELNAAP